MRRVSQRLPRHVATPIVNEVKGVRGLRRDQQAAGTIEREWRERHSGRASPPTWSSKADMPT